MSDLQGKIHYAYALKKCIEKMRYLKETPVVLEALVLFGDFGKVLNQNVESTEFFYLFKGSFTRIYRLTNDLAQYNLKKGDYIYSDLSKRYLGNHLEVFHGDGEVDENGNSLARKAKFVLDLEGNEIKDKTMIALGYREKRNPKDDNKYWWRFKGKKWRNIKDEFEQIVKNREGVKRRPSNNPTDKKFCCEQMRSASEDICCPVVRHLDGSYGFAHCDLWYCPFCGVSLKEDLFGPDKSDNPDFCCETMESTVNYPDDGDQHQIVYQFWTRRYFFCPIRWFDTEKNCPDQEDYPEYDLKYCLYCGKKLPESLLEEWFEIVQWEFCVDRSVSMIQIVKSLPREFVTDAWWKNRKIPLESKVSQVPQNKPEDNPPFDQNKDQDCQVEESVSILGKIAGALGRFIGFKKTSEKNSKTGSKNKIHPRNSYYMEVFHNDQEFDQNGKSLARKAKTVLSCQGVELFELKMLSTGYYNVGGERKFFKQLVRTIPSGMVNKRNLKLTTKTFCCKDMESNCLVDKYERIFCFDSNSNSFYFTFLKCWFCVFCGAKLSCQEPQSLPAQNSEFCCQVFELKRDNPYPKDVYKMTYQCWTKRFLITLSNYGVSNLSDITASLEVQINFCMFCGESFSKILQSQLFAELDYSSSAMICPMEARLQVLEKFHQTKDWWK